MRNIYIIVHVYCIICKSCASWVTHVNRYLLYLMKTLLIVVANCRLTRIHEVFNRDFNFQAIIKCNRCKNCLVPWHNNNIFYCVVKNIYKYTIFFQYSKTSQWYLYYISCFVAPRSALKCNSPYIIWVCNTNSEVRQKLSAKSKSIYKFEDVNKSSIYILQLHAHTHARAYIQWYHVYDLIRTFLIATTEREYFRKSRLSPTGCPILYTQIKITILPQLAIYSTI